MTALFSRQLRKVFLKKKVRSNPLMAMAFSQCQIRKERE
jgi:hypothetical protein